MQKTIRDLRALEEEASALVTQLTPLADSATLVTLSGELGAGKTAFTKAVASVLGITDTLTSPTFVLEKIYALPRGSAFERLIHIDAYRLESAAELAPLGFDTLMQDPKNLIMLEWPEKVTDALPKPAIAISLIANDDGSRAMIYG